MIIEKASKIDAMALAELVNMAGEGLPVYLWERMAEPRENVWDVGCRRASRESGSFSYTNAVCAKTDQQVAACLVGYPLAIKPEEIDNNTPAMFVPLQELENEATGSWYINVLATYPDFRCEGLGVELLNQAEKKAMDNGNNGLSLIVSDANSGARRLYERFGFAEQAKRAMVKEDWVNPGENWILMVKPF